MREYYYNYYKTLVKRSSSTTSFTASQQCRSSVITGSSSSIIIPRPPMILESKFISGAIKHFNFNLKTSHAPTTGATVSLQMPADTTEGNNVEICVDLSSVPSGGLECDVVVELSTTDGIKAS